MGESSVDGMIQGPYSRPIDGEPFMAEDSTDVVVGDSMPTMDLLSGWRDEGSFSAKETSTNALIMDADELRWPPTKRLRSCNCLRLSGVQDDYFSNLTDELIHHILSFLPTLDVVRTCVLAMRWQNLWASTWTNSPSVAFSLPPSLHGRLSEFSDIVDRALNPNASSKLQKLHLSVPYDWTLRTKLNSWLTNAANRNVEDLAVELMKETHKLPRILYSCGLLVNLSLRGCLFGKAEKIEWPSLRVLVLERVELTDNIMKEIFRGSPALEFFKLFSCSGVANIEVNSTNMREMVIGYESSIAGDAVPYLLVKVSAPYLRVLRLLGDWTAKTVSLLDVSSLVEAELKFLKNIHGFDTHSFGMQSSFLRRLLEQLKHVDKITFDHSCLQLVSIFEACRLSLTEMQNKILVLNTKIDRWVIAGIAELLQSSRFLGKLVIDMTSSDISELPVDSLGIPCHDEEVYWVSGQKLQRLRCLKRCLKHVEIVSHNASCLSSKAALALIEFLLREGMVLEKMVISLEGARVNDRDRAVEPVDLWKLLEATPKIQGYPRGSEGAELVFNYRFKGCSFWMDI